MEVKKNDSFMVVKNDNYKIKMNEFLLYNKEDKKLPTPLDTKVFDAHPKPLGTEADGQGYGIPSKGKARLFSIKRPQAFQ